MECVKNKEDLMWLSNKPFHFDLYVLGFFIMIFISIKGIFKSYCYLQFQIKKVFMDTFKQIHAV